MGGAKLQRDARRARHADHAVAVGPGSHAAVVHAPQHRTATEWRQREHRLLERRITRDERIDGIDAPERRTESLAQRVRAEQAALLPGGPHQQQLVRECRGIESLRGHEQCGRAGAVVRRTAGDAGTEQASRLLEAEHGRAGTNTVCHERGGIESEPGEVRRWGLHPRRVAWHEHSPQ